jgi:uncharacterized protein
MPTDEDKNLERLIRGSEDLIRDLDSSAGMGPEGLPREMSAQIDGEPAVPLESISEAAADGSILVEVSRDAMEARAWFHPPEGTGHPLTMDEARRIIQSNGITFGVDWDGVKGCILTCNGERVDVSDIVIARGKAPVAEVAEHPVLSDRLVKPAKPGGAESARIDFKELSLFTLVRKGEVLATLQPPRNGAMGTSVRGAAVPFSREKAGYPHPGKNTEWRGAEVLAACDGRFQLTVDSFWVDEVLDIVGDVDLRVGNIDFPGDVVIRGEVRDGFSVKAGKSILVAGCIGAARVTCGGDLVVYQGVVGKEKAILLVGGTTEAKFLEGCALDAGGPVRIRTSVLNSTVHTADRLEMADKGIIIGAIVKAQNGVSAEQIGTDRGPRTEIHCGVDFKVEQKLVWIRDRGIALAGRLREIEGRMKSGPKFQQVLSPLRDRIKAAIHQLNENARTLVAGLDRNEQAEVAVHGTVFPGAYIEICHVSHFVTKPTRLVSFRLDKATGKVLERAWESRSPVEKKAASPTAGLSAASRRPAAGA